MIEFVRSQIVFFFLQHSASILVPAALELIIVCKEEALERVLWVLDFYGIPRDRPKKILNAQNYSISVNKDVLVGIVQHLSFFIEKIKPITCWVDPKSTLSVLGCAKAWGIRLYQTISNIRRVISGFAFMHLVVADGQVELFEVEEEFSTEESDPFPGGDVTPSVEAAETVETQEDLTEN